MKKNIFAVIFILSIMCTVMLFPSRYLPSVTHGLILFYSTVLPALFPFFFFTKILSGLGFPETCAKIFEKPVRKIFKTPPISAYIFFMSILSGYPIGAKLIGEFYKNNLINGEESKKIITFCSTSAPLFVIGTVSTFMIDNIGYGVIILISHYLSAIFTGIIFCNIKPIKITTTKNISLNTSSDNLIGDSVNSSVTSILSVGGLIAIFSIIIDIFGDIGMLNMFGEKFAPIFTGFLEMTRGCSEIIKNPPETSILIAILTSFVSFGGLCIFLQAMIFLTEAKIKAGYYFAVKCTQSIIGGLIGYIIAIIFV